MLRNIKEKQEHEENILKHYREWPLSKCKKKYPNVSIMDKLYLKSRGKNV